MPSGMDSTPIATIDLIFTREIDQGGGWWTAEADHLFDPNDGQRKHGVVSVQPDKSIQYRPLGTAGPFELYRKDGPTAIFPLRPEDGKVHVFVYKVWG